MHQNPWLLLPQNGNNFVLPIDQSIVSKHNCKSDENYKFHSDPIPEPFIGNIQAPIVALNANPWYNKNEHIIHSTSPTRRIMLDNLCHNYSGFY